jgi:large conductance mechanosensitive channel
VADSLYTQLKKFLVETNAMSLALGVVIGGAVGKLVSSLVEGLIMPIISLMMPAGDWRNIRIVLKAASTAADGTPVAETAIAAGSIIGATLDFIIIAFVVFIVAKRLLNIEVKK